MVSVPAVVSFVAVSVSDSVSVMCDQDDHVVPAHQVDDIDEVHELDPVHRATLGDFGRLCATLGQKNKKNKKIHLFLVPFRFRQSTGFCWGKGFTRTKAACLVEFCAFKKPWSLGACGGGSASWSKGGLVEQRRPRGIKAASWNSGCITSY